MGWMYMTDGFILFAVVVCVVFIIFSIWWTK